MLVYLRPDPRNTTGRILPARLVQVTGQAALIEVIEDARPSPVRRLRWVPRNRIEIPGESERD